ncbi:hypothetical protein EPUS_02192 [Endocarpon pusillum Z07020]|uniref:Peroxisomal membrane protein PEX13 n=1 Tax=Endocarpon pusillum (strain Z07020 / HMAS-L-300199) TaxID=1263415 RepID=U1HPI6_ENDPU|nr:uncharacterized protein EPUS_02192 [Endocarpon pusillum Z07020]ERF72305.1 hypothetical protein EPUS_02192 [Endocarpon pusillum Z07020]
MSTVSPPKPWERVGASANTTTASSNTPNFSSMTTSTNAISTSTSDPPALPSRPSTLNSVVNQTASNYSNYGASRLGTGGYGGYGGYPSYSSPYSRFGGMGGMYGGGAYGGMYGGGMGGMYGGGMGAMPGNPNDPNSLTNSFNQSTQATFQIIESIVGAFGGFAQMLESTYMATHSSFFAMVSVAEQFGNLRNTLGSVLGIFTLLRWFRTLLAKLTGRPPPADATPSCPATAATPAPSGRSASSTTTHRLRSPPLAPNQQQDANVIDPSKLDFCRVLYDYNPPLQSAAAGIDLQVKKGDLVAVLSKTDTMGNPSEWWRCRARDGSVGYLPSPYLETMQRRQPPGGNVQGRITAAAAAGGSGGSAPGSRTQTLKTISSKEEARSKSLSSVGVGAVKETEFRHRTGDGGVESFQKSAFYS